MQVAMTGAGGAIGRVLRPYLLACGYAVRSVDVVPLTSLGETETVLQGDLRDPAVIDRALAGAQMVLHFAGTSVERPLPEIIENNLSALHQLYEGARRHGVRRVVFASSNHAFGMHASGKLLELDAPYRPDSLYGLSKVWGEAMSRLYWEKHGIEGISLRIGSALPRPTETRHLSTWFGEEDLRQLVRCCIEAGDVDCLAVWGVSNNTRRWWSNDAVSALGYRPVQNAEDFAGTILAAAASVDPVAFFYQGGTFAATDYTSRKGLPGG
ncbi:NAD-dependent epimerase/dehydratase family protein [Lichenicola cladoniae]|nr:NAD(P)-dependent oxidoreductase [Lichenicola cladoniae]